MSLTQQFEGPLFIVGMPRSGTKLIRDLLNRNPNIGIPTRESHFIPFMVANFGLKADFSIKNNLRKFYREFVRTNFFNGMKEEGYLLTWDLFSKELSENDWGSIFEFILRFCAPKGRCEAFIWGDKTPGYVNHILLLKRLFPEAKFLHIIRDPRDYCLSVRKTWGRSIYRAAERWRRTIDYAQQTANKIKQVDYMELSYESLLEKPEKVLMNICGFLNCQYTPDMTNLERPTEHYGEAKKSTQIVRSNVQKYLCHFSESEIRRIEEITYPIAKSVGYDVNHAASFKPLEQTSYKMCKLYDGLASFKFNIRNLGIKQGIYYSVRQYHKSSWRAGSPGFDST